MDVPRDREGSFEPQLVRKRERRLTGFDDRILALYARGMSVRDIKGHLQEMYGVKVSPDLISRWRTWRRGRAGRSTRSAVYLNAIVVKIRDLGVVRNKSVYIALGVTVQGNKAVLGLWIEPTEGAKFWLTAGCPRPSVPFLGLRAPRHPWRSLRVAARRHGHRGLQEDAGLTPWHDSSRLASPHL